MPSRNDGGDELTPYQHGKRELSWEQRFQDTQQELGHMKEAVKGRAPVSMDALVQQMESPFMAGVIHFPLPTTFRMPQIEAFDGTKDPVDHLNTYKNQIAAWIPRPREMQSLSITLKGSTLAWFSRLPPASISSFRTLHYFRVPLHRSLDIPESELPLADCKARPIRKPEVLRPKVQLEVIEGRHPR